MHRLTDTSNITTPKIVVMFYSSPQKKSSITTSSRAFFGEQQTPSPFFQPVVQPKLAINSPGDKYEQEADSMADRVMSIPQAEAAPSIQRKCKQCEEEEKGNLMRKATNDGGFHAPQHFESKLAESKGTGTPLPTDTQSFMENAFHADLSHVRIHDNTASTTMSNTIQAKAFTHGSDIYFNSGQYNPHSAEGKHLLAHELTHTQQQGKGGLSLQRQPADAPGQTSFRSANIPLEKWGDNVEQSYRRAGLVNAANAVRDCREWGACDKVLTEAEVYHMYSTGRQQAGLNDPKAQATQQANMAPLAAPLAAGSVRAGAATAVEGATETAAKTALERAAVRWGTASVIEGGASTAPAAAGATVSTVAIPVALGVYVAASIYDLINYGAFQNMLTRQGYIILPSPLGVCIGNCHQPKAPQPSPWLSGPDLLTPTTRQPLTPFDRYPFPFPNPSPWPEDEDKKNGCRSRWIEPKFGRYPCHSDYAKLFSGTRLEYQVTAPDGLTADFDAVRGDMLIEVKTGYEWLLNKHLSPEMQARKKQVISRFMDQSIRQFLIAAECGYDVEWYFNSKPVADMMRDELPHVEVKWRAFNCDKDSDFTW